MKSAARFAEQVAKDMVAMHRRADFYRSKLNLVVSWWSKSIEQYDNRICSAHTALQGHIGRSLLRNGLQYCMDEPSMQEIESFEDHMIWVRSLTSA